MPRKLKTPPATWSLKYIFARGASSALALLFAFFYSRAIGIENRSILAFAMASTLIMAIFFTSGTTLTFRKKFPVEKSTDQISIILGLIVTESLLAGVGVFTSTLLYSNFRIHLASKLIFVILVYSFFATLNLASMDAILAIGKFKLAAVIEILTVASQICIYSAFRIFNISSIAVSVFGSLILSYIGSIAACWFLLLAENTGSLRLAKARYLDFLKATKHNHAYAITNGIVDRLDRIIIAWFLPLGVLGKYAITTSLISYVRFVPDAISKIIISRSHNRRIDSTRRRTIASAILVFGIVGVTVLVSQTAVSLYFGKIWLLPILIPILFSLQETCRGVFQIECSRLMVSGLDAFVAKRNILMALLALPLSILGVETFGLYGVPISLSLNYLFHIFVLHRERNLL